ncbi:hypothetical protein EBZ80_17515 [bacterium]|nr:hypothetical protein [Betaproteobacteria bacterium]NDE16726.1 hypothetical protein [bacterium]
MQPYEFGYRVGHTLEKQSDGGSMLGNVAFGTGGMTGQLDPTQRGLVQDLALYSNPFTGVPTAVNDVSRHLYNGRWMDAGMAGLSGALSFLPGFGFAARGATKGLVQGGKALARAGMPQIGKAVATNAARFADDGARMIQNTNKTISRGIQKYAPLAQNPGSAGKLYNAAIKNPMQAAQFVPLGSAVGTLGMAMAGAGSAAGGNMPPQQYQQPMGANPGSFGGGAAHQPLAGF